MENKLLKTYPSFSNFLSMFFDEGWVEEGETFNECIEIFLKYIKEYENKKKFSMLIEEIDQFISKNFNDAATMKALIDLGLNRQILEPPMSNNATTYREWTQNLRNTLATEYEKMFGEKI